MRWETERAAPVRLTMKTAELVAPALLLVEDNEDDVFIFRRAYRQAGIPNPLHIVGDGEEACAYLFGRGEFADRERHPQPRLVLLDLKLPRKSGLEVLQCIRAEPALADLCVVVLTSSAEERDVLRAYALHAQAYLVKPPSVRTMRELATIAAGKREGGDGRWSVRIAGDLFADGSIELERPWAGDGA